MIMICDTCKYNMQNTCHIHVDCRDCPMYTDKFCKCTRNYNRYNDTCQLYEEVQTNGEENS